MLGLRLGMMKLGRRYHFHGGGDLLRAPYRGDPDFYFFQ